MPGREEIFRLAKAYGISIPRLLRIEKLYKKRTVAGPRKAGG